MSARVRIVAIVSSRLGPVAGSAICSGVNVVPSKTLPVVLGLVISGPSPRNNCWPKLGFPSLAGA